MKKQGWLIVNGFLQGVKYDEMYSLLQAAATKRGVDLLCKRNDELIFPVGEIPKSLPDFVLFWDKDIALARAFERVGVPTFNSARAIEICDNKIRTAEILTERGVKTPKTVFAPKTFEGIGYTKTAFIDRTAEILGYPMVIKEAYGSFGKQVYLANDFAEAVAIVEGIGHKEFIMQEFIRESRGRDIRVNVVGENVVAAMLRYNENDFRSNVSGGGKTQSVTLTEEQERIAIAACRACETDFAGVDVLFGKDDALVCEVNSNPHFKSTLDCTGVDMSECVLDHILEKL
ncbi:MAG: RimK family alpha-L-glutamate ligase [Clostridia bacterium]|nr:RimK family alpha-L-glutamate ligase [Clostridia bacterium]